ncbi:MAG: VWA domain-containing protein [Acidobacteria bacterium]|nr:VWA domain-containing protein [Acidobacteriota bacterium]
MRRKSVTPMLVVLAAAALAAAPGGAPRGPLTTAAADQSQAAPQQPPPVFKAGVKLVRVDVTVLGRGDLLIADLQAADFDVSEDGVPQKVDQLRYVRLDGRRPQGDEESLAIRSQEHAEAEAAREDVRVFVIFLDDYHVDKHPAITIPIRRALKDFIERLWPTDLVAMMDPLTPLDALRFTRVKQELLDVVAKFEGRQGEYYPVRSLLEEAQLRSENPRRMRAQVTFSALAGLCVKLGGLREGRKTVIFVSQGPPILFGIGQPSLREDMQVVIDAAVRANVTIDAVDPESLGMPIREDARASLFQLAGETGGRAVVNTNAMELGMAQVLNETSAYYVLGYMPTRATDDGKYHKISVKVRRSGVRVLARRGYWAPSTKEMEAAAVAAARTLPPGVASAQDLLKTTEPGRRPVEIWVGLSRGGDGRPRAVVTWALPDIARPLPINRLDVEIVSAKGGAPVGPVHTLTAAADAKAERPVEIFTLDPGEYELRYSARTADNSVADRWTQALTVPDFAMAPVSLATPKFYRSRSLAEFRTIRAARDPVPAVVRQFGHNDRVLVDAECYTPGTGETPKLDAHVMTRDGRELTALPVPDLVNGRARFELPVGSLGQGTYLLRVRAKVGSAETELLTAFRVVP